jgi:uncharacterized protein DUF4145
MLSHDDRTLIGVWQQLQSIPAETYICGYCSNKVSSKEGYFATEYTNGNQISFIRICPNCSLPTVFSTKLQEHSPVAAPGNFVGNVPPELDQLYSEARQSIGAGAFTGAVLLCRKILMHIAFTEGAKPNQSFLDYVRFLADKGFVPPHGVSWVDYIRVRGNEANHEIKLMKPADAEALVTFVEMLLKFIYEFPNRVPNTVTISDS